MSTAAADPTADSDPAAAEPAAPTPAGPDPSSTALDDLRASVAGLLAAERRLRSRDHAPGELTYAHIRSLQALGEGELTAGQLARSAELNPASVTAMLDHLEESGIVERRRTTTDRRVCLVALTEEGRRLLDSKTTAWKATWADHLAGHDEAELRSAERVVREIAEMLDSITRRRAPAPR